MKVGDKAYGFKFESLNNSGNITYNEKMNRFIDIEGTIRKIESNKFSVRFNTSEFNDDMLEFYWEYPIAEYLSNIRDKKLNELGI